MADNNIKVTFKQPAKLVCTTIVDEDGKMTKIIYNEDGTTSMHVTMLPKEERKDVSVISEYADGTILSSVMTSNGTIDLHVNKPIKYNPFTGDMEVNKEEG